MMLLDRQFEGTWKAAVEAAGCEDLITLIAGTPTHGLGA